MMGVRLLRLWLCLALAAGGVAFAGGRDEFAGDPLIKEHKWEEGKEFYGKKLVELAESGKPKPDKELLHLVLCYEISRYFGEMSGEDASALSGWLLGEPDFAAELLGAFTPKDSPEQAFAVLAQIRKRFGDKTVLKLSGLAIAHAVVWDAKKPISEKFGACDSFGYYVSNAGKMTFNLSELPWQAAIFLAGAEASPEERSWALAKYKQPKSMRSIYHEPKYDHDSLFGQPKKIAGHDYTLPNILEYGGVCSDRAYYAANVARSCGMPAARIGGRGERGGHAWTGCLTSGKRGRYVWDLDCGRYEGDHYYVGATRDPQTGARIKDYELSMRTMACSLSPAKRRVSHAFTCVAEMLEKEEKFDLVKSALDEAIQNDRFNLAAWGHITRLCKAGTFDAKYADSVLDDALKKFPDEPRFCYGIFETLMTMVPKEEYARRKRLYKQAATCFKDSPDLAVAVGRDYGDYLLEMDKKRQAYDVYHETIRAHMDDPMLVADLAIKVSEKRMEGDEAKKAVQLLTALIKYSKKPPYDDAFAKHSAWYRLNTCLKGVYTETGEQKKADAIEAELAKYRRR